MSEQYPNYEQQLTSQEVFQASAEFLQYFGVEADPRSQPQEFLNALHQLDPRYKDNRDLVRWQLEADQTQWPEEANSLFMSTAERMRMLEPETPLVGHYDVVVALGGARQSNSDRTLYAAQAINEGRASAEIVVVAGSGRKLNEAEQQNTANYALGARTEADLCAGAATVAKEEYPELNIDSFGVDEEKAGTPAVLEALFSKLFAEGKLTDSSAVAAVTTQIYQASTELDLARVAKKFGITETFTAGNPSDPNIVAKRTPATYLSEILRTLRAATLAAQSKSE